jgi:hypothetical protein
MRAANCDSNQAAIVDALRTVGASVQHLHTLGQGVPDLLVAWHGRNHLLEVKSPKGGLNEMQRKWHELWRGEVHVVRTPEEALRAIGVLR